MYDMLKSGHKVQVGGKRERERVRYIERESVCVT